MRFRHLVLTMFAAASASAEQITCSPSGHPFANGYCSVLHSNGVEGWLRASASLDNATGKVHLEAQLESDSIFAGPRGQVSVVFLSASGKELATVSLGEELSRGGKGCGRAVDCGRSTYRSSAQVPLLIAQRTASLRIAVKQTGVANGVTLNLDKLLGMDVAVPVKIAALDQNLKPTTVEVTLHPSNPADLDDTERIIRGDPVPNGAYPWTAALYRPRTGGGYLQVCGGSLIDASWVMTAAHCKPTKEWKVVLARTNLSNPSLGEVTAIEDVVVHEAYDAGTKNADIALLKLKKKSGQPVVAVTDAAPETDLGVIVTGWGVTAAGGSPSATLQQVDIRTIDPAACRTAYTGRITDTMLCAGIPAEGKDACQGDSGGPLFRQSPDDPGQYVQYGIVSWGEGCGRPDKPGVYTSVAKMKPWVDFTVRSWDGGVH